MPLIKSGSKKAIGNNISEMEKAGHPRDQSIAAALETARKYGKANGGAVGMAGGGDVIKAILRRLGLLGETASQQAERLAAKYGDYRKMPGPPDSVIAQELRAPVPKEKEALYALGQPNSYAGDLRLPSSDAAARAEQFWDAKSDFMNMGNKAPSDYKLHANGGAVGYADGGGPKSPVPDWLLKQQADVQSPEYAPKDTGMPGPLSFLGDISEFTGIPSALRASDAYRKGNTGQAVMEAAPAAMPLLGKIPRAVKTVGVAGLIAGLMGRDSGAGEPPADPRAAEIAKLQAEIAKHQQSVAQTIKDIAAARFRGVGEEAGMARQKALEEAARPYNDAIAAAQTRIAQLRGAGDEEKNRLVRAERTANEARKEEVARGKPFLEKDNPVSRLYDTFGMYTPGVVAAATGMLGRIAHGPKAKVLPVLEATGFGLTAAHGPTADKAFFSPVDNPQRAGAQAYAQELARANHPEADKWQHFADDKERFPLVNPVRTEGQKEFWDPTKFAERTGLGAIEGISGGLFGSGIGNAARSGLSNLWSGIRSGPKPSSPVGSSGGAPTPQGPAMPGSLGTAAETPKPLPSGPGSKPPSPSPLSDTASSIPEVVILKPGKSGKTLHEKGKFSSEKTIKERYSKNKPETEDGMRYGGAMDIARKYADGGAVHVGPLMGDTPGRADAIKTQVPPGAYVIPADVIAACGGGNTGSGMTWAAKSFGPSQPQHAASGGAVPVLLSDGEYVLSPDQVAKVGGGDLKQGHRILDSFVVQARKRNVDALKKLPGPSR